MTRMEGAAGDRRRVANGRRRALYVRTDPDVPRGDEEEMKRLSLAALAAAITLAACGGGPGEPQQPRVLNATVPAEAASIIGEVTQVEGSGDGMRVLVEQVPTRSAGYPIAWVFVHPRTRILVRTGGGAATVGSRADLVDGARVQAWFTGAVRESYPVQADAGTLLVER